MECYTAEEVAAILKVQPHRVYGLIRSGGLPAVRLGQRQVRVSKEALEEFIRRGGQPAPAGES